MDEEPFYFSIHGNDERGWTLTVYTCITDGKGRKTDAVTSFKKPDQFGTFKELLEHVVQEYEGKGV